MRTGVRSPVAALLLLAVSGVATARAQPPGDRRRGGPARDEAFRMVDAYMVSNLQESLGLTDEQFVKALPLVKRLLSERREVAERRRETLRDLRQMLQSGAATEAKVAERLGEVKALENDEREKTKRNLDGVDSVLTPLQQAKFRVMEVEIEQKIRELLNQARQRRRPGELSPP